jgi:type IV pilus assembly protein PilC
VAALAISALMTVFLFPKLLPIFQSLNVPLPFTTRALLLLSFVLINYWFYILLAIVALIAIFIVLMRMYKPFRYAMHNISLKLPIIGAMLKDYYLTNICRISGTLFKSQLRVLETLEVTAETTTNLVYRDRLEKLRHTITKGGKISTYFRQFPKLFPAMLSNMVAVGETTGSLSDTLIYLGEIHESELDEQTKRLSSIIEPVLMVGVGLMVGFIAVSIITPIYEVTQHLNPR